MPAQSFWRPPLWKWAILLALLSAVGVLLRWKPSPRPVEIELLPITDSLPGRDGSYPAFVIAVTSEGDRARFHASVSTVRPTVRHDAPVNQFEVALDTGMFELRQTDLFVVDVMPLSLTRTYSVWDKYSRAFGVGANHPYDICPTGTSFPYTYMDLNLEDGRQTHLPRISKGTGYEDAVFRNGDPGSEFYDARIGWDGKGWTMNFRDGRQVMFPESYHAKTFAQGAPIEMRDERGNRLQLKRDNVRNLRQLISPSGHTISFKYDGSDRIVEAADDAGHIRRYSYAVSGQLETVSDGTRTLYRFDYGALRYGSSQDSSVMTRVIDGDGRMLLKNTYLSTGRISEQQLANGDVYRFGYWFDSRGSLIRTNVTLPSGEVKSYFFLHGAQYFP